MNIWFSRWVLLSQSKGLVEDGWCQGDTNARNLIENVIEEEEKHTNIFIYILFECIHTIYTIYIYT